MSGRERRRKRYIKRKRERERNQEKQRETEGAFKHFKKDRERQIDKKKKGSHLLPEQDLDAISIPFQIYFIHATTTRFLEPVKLQ